MSSSTRASAPAAAGDDAMVCVLREVLGAHATPALVDELLQSFRGSREADGGGALPAVLRECQARLGPEVAEMVRTELRAILGPALVDGSGNVPASSPAEGQPRQREGAGLVPGLAQDEDDGPEIEIVVDPDDLVSDVYPADSVRPLLESQAEPSATGPDALDVDAFEPPSRRDTAVPEAALTVLLVTATEGLSRAVRAGLPPTVTIQQVRDLFELLDAVQRAPGGVRIAVDCSSPSVGPASIATLWPDLPEGTLLLLWGGHAEQLEELSVLLGEQVEACVRLVPAGVDHLLTQLLVP